MAIPVIPILIVAGGAYAVSEAKKAKKAKKAKHKQPGNVTADEQREFDKLIRDLAGGKTTKTPGRQNAPLAVVMDLQVSGAEKFAIGFGAMGGKSGLRKKAYALALDIQKKVPGSCPGAPVMLGKPTQTMASIDGGYRIVTKWGANWRPGVPGPVRPAVRDCIRGLLKKTAIGKRIVAFNAVRTA